MGIAGDDPSGGTHARVLIIVQNLPVPLDRRVWLECQALKAAGYEVTVICPKGPGDPAYQEIAGIRIHKYTPPPAAEGFAGFAVEFTYCWFATARRAIREWQRQRFDVIQACNPPDTYWALALPFKFLGVKFVFDQHDLNPELYLSRFGEPTSLAGKAQLGALRWLERMTYRSADHVISTNESYARVARDRGGLTSEDVTVVRSGPNTATMRPVISDISSDYEGKHVLAYLGIMGPQDGVDIVLEVVDLIVHRYGRTDVHAVLMGFGDCLDDLKRQSTELGLDDFVTFTGRVTPPEIADYLSVAEIGMCPDPKNPLNDISTMNKTMEYMSYALPVVSFDLQETRYSAQECAVFVEPGDIDGFARATLELIDDPERRAELGFLARERVAAELDWEPQSRAYVSVFDHLFGVVREYTATWPYVDRRRRDVGSGFDAHGRRLIDLRDSSAIRRFAADRGGDLTLARRAD
jgi:glycosyltransferase involved in cell wall biosynthesis